MSLQGSQILIHGPPKVGKTQLASSFPEPVQFLATEEGHKFLPKEQKETLIRIPEGATGWSKFLKCPSAILKRKPKTVVIDTVGPLYYSCMEKVAKDMGISHPSEESHGKGWAALRTEFRQGLGKLINVVVTKLGASLLLIDHSKMEEIDTSVETYHRISLAMTGQARSIVIPIVDYLWYLGFDAEPGDESALKHFTDNRSLWVDGTNHIEAGTRDPNQTTHIITKLPKTKQFAFIERNLYGKQTTKRSRQAR